MPIKLYGLMNCDACKKALKTLKTAEKEVVFVDIREDTDLSVKAPEWLASHDVRTLLNTRSTTWRGLTDEEKAMAEGDKLVDLLIAHPALVKRPVIEADGYVHIGWNKEVELALI